MGKSGPVGPSTLGTSETLPMQTMSRAGFARIKQTLTYIISR